MKKLLITKRLTALLWTLVLALMPMSLMADNTPLSVTVINTGGGIGDQYGEKAFDGDLETKWCGDISTVTLPFVEVQLKDGKSSKLDYYFLYTGNDINYENAEGKQMRNPKEWKLYAKVNEGDDWTLISHVTDAGLPITVSTRSENYKIDAAYQNIEYNYFRFEILGIEQGNIYEVSEICLINCAHEYAEGSAICSICGTIKEHDHSYSNGVVTKEPTCAEQGEMRYTCTRCGHEKIERIATIPHNYGYDLKCTVCRHEVDPDNVIEYTASKKLCIDLGEDGTFDYTDKIPDDDKITNWGSLLFGAAAIQHLYNPETKKGHIICRSEVIIIQHLTAADCDYLTSITLPSKLQTISDNAFFNYKNLTSVTILAKYSPYFTFFSLGFKGCDNMKEIIVPYTSYADYIESCDVRDHYILYKDENGEEYRGDIKALFKSLLSLDDTKAFETPKSVKVDATLQRSFADDGWYSLCLPFSLTAEQTAEKFAQVAEFSEVVGNTYKFTTVNSIEAGKPYIVKVKTTLLPLENPKFANVTIAANVTADESGTFVGVLKPTEVKSGDLAIGSGTTVNPMSAGTIKAFRAYFPKTSAGAKAMRFTVDDGEATVVQSPIEATDYKLQTTSSFNLAGQKVDENYRGIVIKNGKKYLNK